MSTPSRNERRKRRLKQNNSLLQRALKTESLARAKGMVVLCAVLGQKGGEVTITKGTLQQAIEHLSQLSYDIRQTEEGELLVKLITLTDTATTQAVIKLETEPAMHRDTNE